VSDLFAAGLRPVVAPRAYRHALADADPLLLWRCWLPEADHDRLLHRLGNTIPWEQHTLQTPAGPIPAPRLECWFAERAGVPYVYSGERYLSQQILPELADLRDRVNEATGLRFDALFANLYRLGRDSIGWHADAEVDALGPLADIQIASLSLGARRKFAIRHRDTDERWSAELGEGDLLLMGRGVQSAYLHCAPKTATDVGPRLNLTFRRLHARV
jgi:alkylated DNA repair dioxygenase AlkB